MTRRIIIAPYGYLGDTIFATSVARKLKEEKQYDAVDMIIGVPQAEGLVKMNPWIDVVWTTVGMQVAPLAAELMGSDGRFASFASQRGYQRAIQLQPTTKLVPPPYQFQQECNVYNPDTHYEVFTSPVVDEKVLKEYEQPYVAVMHPNSWTEKAFLFTQEQYDAAVNIPYKGYGGALRNIQMIVDELAKFHRLVYVGGSSNQSSQYANSPMTLMRDASIIKHAQFFIGAEGGLANVAAGVGTKTALTSDYVHQLYGYKGCIQPFPEPKLGPRYYFPEAGHIDLNPYLTDAEVLSEYMHILCGEKHAENYSYDWTH